jgi:hypothetical protein
VRQPSTTPFSASLEVTSLQEAELDTAQIAPRHREFGSEPERRSQLICVRQLLLVGQLPSRGRRVQRVTEGLAARLGQRCSYVNDGSLLSVV